MICLHMCVRGMEKLGSEVCIISCFLCVCVWELIRHDKIKHTTVN